VGAGTVLTLPDAERCLEAGARFVVSPCYVDGLTDLCREAGAACLPGALTPTEAMSAWRAGATAVKVFPAASVGGPAHVKALRSVLPEVPLVPTGGVTPKAMPAYLAAGAAAVGVGGELIAAAALGGARGGGAVAPAARFLAAGRPPRPGAWPVEPAGGRRYDVLTRGEPLYELAEATVDGRHVCLPGFGGGVSTVAVAAARQGARAA